MILKILILIFIVILMAAGLAGTILPLLPGPILIFGGAFLYILFFGAGKVGVEIIITLGIIALISFLFDFIAGGIGAKKFGASRSGIIGAILGGIIGLFIGNIFGLILGPLFGAFLAEIVAGRSFREAGKAGIGAFIGFLGGTVMRFVLGFIMILIFVFALLF